MIKVIYNKTIVFLTYLLGFYLLYTPNIGYIIDDKIILSKHLLIPIIFIMLALYCCVKKIKIVNYKVLLPLFIVFVISIIYSSGVALINGYRNIQDLRIIQNSLVLFHIGSLVLLYNILKSKKKYNIYDFLFKIAAIQSVICIIMMIFPETKEIANNLYFFSAGVNNNTEYFATVRIFGITDDYTFMMPIIHSFLASISLVFGITKEKKYLLYTPIILLVGILNNRTSVFLFCINTFILIIALLISKQYRDKVKKSIIPIILICIVGIMLIKLLVPNTYRALKSGFNQVYSLIFKNEQNGNVGILVNDMLFFPEGNDLIFGTGKRVYGSQLLHNSDIGYVNDIFMGGIIYITILYSGVCIYLFKNWKKTRFEDRVIIICSIITLVISNIKGECMHGGILLSLIILIKYITYDNPIRNRKVSIIMSTYDTPCEFLKTAINSILNQTYKNIELIVVCDGSKKDEKIVKEYKDKRIKCVLNSKNRGLPYSLNKGIEISSGYYIARMDSDDISCPDRIESQVRFMDSNEDIDICGMQAMFFGEKEGILSTFANDPESMTIQLMYECNIVHPTVMWRKRINIKYNEEFTCSQDFELWTRISEKNNLTVIKKVGLYYRVHEKQATVSKREKQLEMTKKIIQNNISSKEINHKNQVIKTMLILSGVVDVTEKNYLKLASDIDKIIKDNSIYDKAKLKKILYNRYFRRMLNHNMVKTRKKEIITNSNIRNKIVNIYNIRNILFVVKNNIKSIKHKLIVKKIVRRGKICQ